MKIFTTILVIMLLILGFLALSPNFGCSTTKSAEAASLKHPHEDVRPSAPTEITGFKKIDGDTAFVIPKGGTPLGKEIKKDVATVKEQNEKIGDKIDYTTQLLKNSNEQLRLSGVTNSSVNYLVEAGKAKDKTIDELKKTVFEIKKELISEKAGRKKDKDEVIKAVSNQNFYQQFKIDFLRMLFMVIKWACAAGLIFVTIVLLIRKMVIKRPIPEPHE